MAETVAGTANEIKDSTSNVHHGSGTGGATTYPTQINGIVGKALQFDGVNDLVSFGDNADYRYTAAQSFTVSAWLNPTSVLTTSSDDGAISKWGSGNFWGIWAHFKDTSAGATWSIAGTPQIAGGNEDVNEWQNVSFVQTASTSRVLFLNGTQNNNGNADDSSQVGNLNFGNNPSGSGASLIFYTGSIDEVRISNTARSSDWQRNEFRTVNGDLTSFGSVESH